MNASKLATRACKIAKSGDACSFCLFIAQLLKNINRLVFGCDIAWQAKIGKNLQLPHQGLGVVIAPGATIGDNVCVFQNVTIGAKTNGEKGYSIPVIGDNVLIGSGAKILGGVHVGSNSTIGANAVVLNDVPDNVVAVGVPAVVVKEKSI